MLKLNAKGTTFQLHGYYLIITIQNKMMFEILPTVRHVRIFLLLSKLFFFRSEEEAIISERFV